jgi:hypothetical protein
MLKRLYPCDYRHGERDGHYYEGDTACLNVTLV